jgi:GNAT superfamily N-acetyltransferase
MGSFVCARRRSSETLVIENSETLVGNQCEHIRPMASTEADNVSRRRAPLSANLGRKPRCLRARAPMIASAYTYWCDLAAALAVRGRRLIVARSAGRITGTLQLILAMPPNGGHRAEVAKLMVNPDFRRLRIAQAMLRFAERIARQESRTLLIGTTRTGGPTEHINSLLGFKRAGVVPHYVRGPHGELSDTSFMYKDLTK